MQPLGDWSWKKLLVTGAGVLIGIILAGLIRCALRPSAETQSNQAQAAAHARVSAILNEHLLWADEQNSSGLDLKLVPLFEMFANARGKTRSFADDVLSFESKWKLTTDYFTGSKDHAAFMEQRFAARLFSPEELEQIVQLCVASYVQHLSDVESQLLVRLQRDLADVPTEELPIGVDRQAIQYVLQAAIDEAVRSVEADFQGVIGRELVSYVAGEVLTVAAVEMATSAGILTAGTSSGTVTFGAGIVVGIVADYLVSWAYDQLFDPVGEISGRLNDTLTGLEQLILYGTEDQPGLDERLRDYAARRSQARNVSIQAALLQ